MQPVVCVVGMFCINRCCVGRLGVSCWVGVGLVGLLGLV
jgi:hypothetical protein